MSERMDVVSPLEHTGVFQNTQSALMQAVAETATALVAGRHWQEVLPLCFPRIVAATGVDRLILLRLERHATGTETGAIVGEWIAADSQRVPVTLGTHVPVKTARYDYSRWMQQLRAGQVFSFSGVDTLPEGERELVRRVGVQAMIRVPLMLNGTLWGALGFDHLSHAREWRRSELITLGSLAKLLAACIERDGEAS